MASWLIPALKAILPHVGTIVDAAKPVFTRKKAETAPEPGALVQQQIAELQAAVSQNAEYIKELAEQLQSTVSALEKSAVLAEARLRRATLAATLAVPIAAVALLVAMFSYLRS